MRVAETRVVILALGNANGIGFCPAEESGARSSPPRSATIPYLPNGAQPSKDSGSGRLRLRDQRGLLIRLCNLDPDLMAS